MAKSASASRSEASEKQSERSSNAPVFNARHRAIKAAVWKNDTENGAMFNTTVSRSYKDDNDQWRESGSFGFDDVLIVAELLRTCHGFIMREMAKGNSESAQG